MIRTFNARRILFTPVSWLNSVANWLLGVHSDSGTVKISNTASPGDTGPSVDVDVPTVAKKLDTYLRDSYPKVRDAKLLGASLKWENGQLEVDDNWLKARVIDNDSADPNDSSSLPKDVGETASAGESTKASRSDHVHALPVLNNWTGDQQLTGMFEVKDLGDGEYSLGFHAPVFDKFGRFKGLSQTLTEITNYLA